MRKRHNFWLDDRHAGDVELDQLISELKQPGRGKGRFTRAIRQGLCLWKSLCERRTDVLIELFPWVVDEIAKRQPPPDDSDLVHEIRQLQLLILQQGEIPPPPPEYPSMKPSGKQLGLGKMLAAPTFEDNDLLEFTAPKSTIDVSENLVRNMFGLQR